MATTTELDVLIKTVGDISGVQQISQALQQLQEQAQQTQQSITPSSRPQGAGASQAVQEAQHAAQQVQQQLAQSMEQIAQSIQQLAQAASVAGEAIGQSLSQGVRQGAEQTQQAVQPVRNALVGVQEQAQQTQQALSSLSTQQQQTLAAMRPIVEAAFQQQQQATQVANQQVRELLQAHGATQDNLRAAIAAVRQQGGAPDLTARSLGIDSASDRATQSAQRVTAATRQTGESFRLTTSEAARFAAAAVGIGSGLSIVATVGQSINRVLGEAIQKEIDFERASRGATAAFGAQQAQQVVQQARAFQARPDTRGTATDFLQASTGLRQFQAEADLSTQTMDRLKVAAGQFALAQGTDFAPAMDAVVAAVRGNSSALAAYGVALTDASGRVSGLNATYDELVQTVGKTRAEQLLANNVIKDAGDQAATAAPQVDSLAQAMDRLGKVSDSAKGNLGAAMAPIAQFLAVVATGLLSSPSAGLAPAEGGGYGAAWARETAIATGGQDELKAAVDQATGATNAEAVATNAAAAASSNAATAAQTQLNAYEQLSLAILHTTEALDRLSSRQGQFATLQQALAGPSFPQAASETTIRNVAAQQAAQELIAQQAQRVAQSQATNYRQQLEEVARVSQEIGPNAVAAAQAQIDKYDQLTAAHQALLQGQREQNRLQQQGVQLAGAEAAIQLRYVPVQQQIASQQRELNRLRLEGQRAALAPQEALQDLQYLEQRNRLIAQDRSVPISERAQARRDLRAEFRQQPGVERAALEAQRAQTPVDRALQRLSIEAGLQQNAMETALAPVQAMIQQNQLLQQIAAAVVAGRQQQVDVIISGALDVNTSGDGQLSDANKQAIVDAAGASFTAQFTAALNEADRARSARLVGAG